MFILEYMRLNGLFVSLLVSVMTCFLMDIATTFEIETRVMWKSRLSPYICLFFAIRYLPPLCIATTLWGTTSYEIKFIPHACEILWALGFFACTVFAQCVTEILMLMRVWALYGFTKRMFAFCTCLFFIRTSLSIWTGVTQLRSTHRMLWTPEDYPVPGCPFTQHIQSWTIQINCTGNMITTGIVFALMLNTCIARHKSDVNFLGTWRDLIGIRTAWPLIHVILRDGCINFFAILSAELILLVISFVNPPLTLFALPLIQTIYPITATRLALNLRERTCPTYPSRPEDVQLHELSRLEFAPRRSYQASIYSVIVNSEDSGMLQIQKGERDIEREEEAQITGPEAR